MANRHVRNGPLNGHYAEEAKPARLTLADIPLSH